jgi:2-desacetyl-2-hydroxyethyl bacteriochlorophyllide A dehydrogenase
MKVAMYRGIKSITLEEQTDPRAAPGDVIIKVKYCGICGTDVHAYHYEELYPRDTVLGHEIVGTIAEVGKDIKAFRTGDRVVVSGMGGYAEYIKLSSPQTSLYRIPDEVSFEEAVLWDPIAVPLHGIRQSHFRLGDNVVVAGAGAIGLSCVQLLRIGGARHITVLEPVQKKRELARTFGASAGLNPLEGIKLLVEQVKAFNNGSGVDVAFECAGVPQSLLNVIDLVKRGGQVLLLGVTEKATPLKAAELVKQEIELKATLAFRDEDIRLSLDFLAQHRFSTRGMVSDIISLDDVVKGMERLISPEESLVKVLVAP